MCESSGTIEEYALELACLYGVSYSAALADLWHVIGCGYGIAPPLEVSAETFAWLQEELLRRNWTDDA